MLVPVQVDAASNAWSLVELQGELLGAEQLRGLELGSLRFGAGGGAPTLRVGNHILAGKVAPLAKPFAVLRKSAGASGGDDDGGALGFCGPIGERARRG